MSHRSLRSMKPLATGWFLWLYVGSLGVHDDVSFCLALRLTCGEETGAVLRSPSNTGHSHWRFRKVSCNCSSINPRCGVVSSTCLWELVVLVVKGLQLKSPSTTASSIWTRRCEGALSGTLSVLCPPVVLGHPGIEERTITEQPKLSGAFEHLFRSICTLRKFHTKLHIKQISRRQRNLNSINTPLKFHVGLS